MASFSPDCLISCVPPPPSCPRKSGLLCVYSIFKRQGGRAVVAHALIPVLWRQRQLHLLSLRPSWSTESSKTARANYTERPHLKKPKINRQKDRVRANPPDTPMGRTPGLLFPCVFATHPFPIAHTLYTQRN